MKNMYSLTKSNIFSIDTEPVSLSGEGLYALSEVKEIAVTDSFLSLDEQTKACQNQITLEDCWMQNYFTEGIKKCKCTPYALRNYSREQVFITLVFIFISQ